MARVEPVPTTIASVSEGLVRGAVWKSQPFRRRREVAAGARRASGAFGVRAPRSGRVRRVPARAATVPDMHDPPGEVFPIRYAPRLHIGRWPGRCWRLARASSDPSTAFPRRHMHPICIREPGAFPAGDRACDRFAAKRTDRGRGAPTRPASDPYDDPMKLSVALVQLDATDDVDGNIERATALADEAAQGGARLVALPEYLQYRGPTPASARAPARSRANTPTPSPRSHAATAPGSSSAAWPRRPTTRSARTTRSVLIDPDGDIAATYRKIHLFDVAVDQGPVRHGVGAGDPGRRRRDVATWTACPSA